MDNEHLVDVHVGHLRRKLGDDPAEPRYVITVRGVGYLMGSGTVTTPDIPHGVTAQRMRRGPGIGVRLLVAQALVLVAGGATTWIVAVIVGAATVS